MKKKISVVVFTASIAIFIALSIASCGNKSKDNIAQNWKLESMNIPGQDSLIASMDSAQRPMYQAMMKQMIEKSAFNFTKDGKFTVDMGFVKSEGTYKISDDGQHLSTTEMMEGKPSKAETVDIAELTATKFVMKQKDPSGKVVTMTLVPAAAKAK
jgi:hypothetical protein